MGVSAGLLNCSLKDGVSTVSMASGGVPQQCAMFAGMSRGDLVQHSAAFEKQLAAAKSVCHGIAWYPYGTLTNVAPIANLLRSASLEMDALTANEPILDVGCGDGDFAFFLEQLGCEVDAVDWPATNYNGMRGVSALKDALRSGVSVQAMDLDRIPNLPREHYGLIVCLGLLYHLKNPIQLLETLAQSCRYCLLNTRVAAIFPGVRESVQAVPVAYLVGQLELNNDWTNYWIFSAAGLLRLVERCGFEIVAMESNQRSGVLSTPAGKVDERVFLLLRSRIHNATFDGVELLSGWHKTENGGWRWTSKSFSVAARKQAARVRVVFYLPEAQIAAGPVRVQCFAEGVDLGSETYGEAGEHSFERDISGVCGIQFQVSHQFANAADGRELGIFVRSVQFE